MNKPYAFCSPLRMVKVVGGYIYEVTAYFIYDRKPESLDIEERDKTADCIGFGSLQGFGKTSKEAKEDFWKEWNKLYPNLYLDTGLYTPQYNNDTI